jgi:protein-L-isoaspartate(D-aspartate) O-methyltransferase
MDRDTELMIVRRAYAKQVLAAAGVRDARIEDAFAVVRREDFLGPGPWPFFHLWPARYVPSPDADPVYLYTDSLVGIVPDRFINNGQPSLHAALLAQARPSDGEHVVHVGAGVGYYTAIMAHLVGPTGRVTGIEFDADLAARARANFGGAANVEILQGDGAVVPFATADVIYVNAGATHPAPAWLDGLAEGGRLILPLTTELPPAPTPEARAAVTEPAVPTTQPRARITELRTIARQGATFLIERRGPEYLARWISPVMIFPCAGSRDRVAEAALAAGFAKGGWEKVTRLYRGDDVPPEQCWVRAPGWCLAYS